MVPSRSRPETAPVSPSLAAEDHKEPAGPADTDSPATLRRAATATARATLNTQRGATEHLSRAEASRGTAPRTPGPIKARHVRAPGLTLAANNQARAVPEDKAQAWLGDTPQAAPGSRGPCTQIHLPEGTAISPPVAHNATQEAARKSPRTARHLDTPQAAAGDRGPSTQIHLPADTAVSPQPAHRVILKPTRASPRIAQPMDNRLPLSVTRVATAKATPKSPRTDRPRPGPVPGTPRPHPEDRPRPAPATLAPVGARSRTLPTPALAPEPERDKEAANRPLLTAPPPRVPALLVPSTMEPSPGTVTVTAKSKARQDQAADRSTQLCKGSARREVTAAHGTGLDTLAPVST